MRIRPLVYKRGERMRAVKGLLILAVLIAGTGLNLDYHHFAHLSKDSAFDGVSYIGHTALSVAGTVVAIIFFGSKRRS